MTPDLFSIRGRNRYCGPAAIAALTGLTTDDSAFLLRAVTGRRRIQSIKPLEILSVLFHLNFSVDRFQLFPGDRDGPDLGEWLDWFPAPATGVSLIATTRHFQVVSGEALACSLHRTPVSWRHGCRRSLRQRVEAVWAVSHPRPAPDPQPQPVFNGE